MADINLHVPSNYRQMISTNEGNIDNNYRFSFSELRGIELFNSSAVETAVRHCSQQTTFGLFSNIFALEEQGNAKIELSFD